MLLAQLPLCFPAAVRTTNAVHAAWKVSQASLEKVKCPRVMRVHAVVSMHASTSCATHLGRIHAYWWLHACIDATCVVCCIMQNRMKDVQSCCPVVSTDLDSFSWSTAISKTNIYLCSTLAQTLMMHDTHAAVKLHLMLDLHSRLHTSACSSLM